MSQSLAEQLYDAGDWETFLDQLSPDDALALERSWGFWARPEQQAPTRLWRWWVLMAGRGFGKGRTGAEWVCDRAEQFARVDAPHRVGLIERTLGHVHRLMVGGPGGLARVAERRGHRLHLPANAAEGTLKVGEHATTLAVHTAEDPERVRGENFHTLWCDELSVWRHRRDAEGGTAFTNADFALRLPCPNGLRPQGLITMTPKPVAVVRELVAGKYEPSVLTRGTTYDNIRNLAPDAVDALRARYEGTRLGAQELEGQLLDTVEGALWQPTQLEASRVTEAPALARVVVGVDPPGGERTECGIVAGGVEMAVRDRRHFYVVDDASMAGAPEAWGAQAVACYHRTQADAIVAEVNYGGEMVRAVIHNVDPNVVVRMAHASRGKAVRAEPVAMLWDQQRGHMVGYFGELEAELVTWVPGDPLSPNRLDAMVWAATDLLPELARPPALLANPARL